MKKLIILIWSCLSFVVHAQEAVDIFGYFESQLMGARIKSEFLQLQSNKVRVDLEGHLNKNVTFGANFNTITYHGKTQWPILDLLPQSVQNDAAELNLMGIEMDPYTLIFEDRSYLDNAFARISFSKIDLTIGKQQLSFGTGYAWNPTDLFNIKDLMDPAYEQPGHNGIRLDWLLSNKTTWTLVYSVDAKWAYSTKLCQFNTRLGHFDVALIGAETSWKVHDYTQLNLSLTSPGFVQMTDKRHMLGMNWAGELFGLGFWGEAAHHALKINSDYQDVLLGLDYTFNDGSYVMGEYFFNGQGKSHQSQYQLNDWMRFLAAEQKTMTRQQVYAIALFPVTDFMKLGMSSIFVLTDNSVALLPTLNWSVSENVELVAYGNIYAGKETAVYHPGLGSGGMIRAKVYF